MSPDSGGYEKTAGPRSAKYSIAAILVAMFLWAISFPILIWILREVPPLTLAAVRSVILIPPLAIYLHCSVGMKGAVKALRKDWVSFSLIGITTVVIPNITQNIGMVLNESSSISSILQSSGPVYMVILAVIFLRERLGVWQYFGLGLGLIGSVLLATDGLQAFSGGTFIGNALIIISAVSYAFSSIFGKKALETHKPMLVIAWSSIIGGIMLIPPAFLERTPMPSPSAWALIIILALTSSFFAYILWYSVMAYTPVSNLAAAIYLVPVMAIILSFFLLGETLTLRVALFASMILAGVAVAQIKQKRKTSKKEALSST